MIENFQKIIPWVLSDEGGYTNDPDDPGGPTKFGITLYDYKKWTGNPHAAAEDVKDMPESMAHAIYRKYYWDSQQCDKMPTGVDYFLFDSGLLHGIGASKRWLQLAVGAKQDGDIGPKTLEAVSKADPSKVLVEMEAVRRRYCKSRPGWKKFGQGWTNRVNKCKARALKLVEGKL